MPNTTYNGFLEALAKGQVNLATADVRVLLVAGYVPDKDHRFVADITNEITVTGYARKALTGKVVVRDDALDFAYLDADDVLWMTLAPGQTVTGAVLFVDLGADAVSLLIGHYSLPATPTRDFLPLQFAAPVSGGVVKLVQL
jgi:hypothetical protein